VIPVNDPSCTYPCHDLPFQILPLEYQGWFILIFSVVATISILYVLYLIALIPEKETPVKANVEIEDKKVKTQRKGARK
jgi:hypothetical protein